MDVMIVTRFAPSPTGYLHLGHALAALVAHDAAQAGGGRFLLRIEDLDVARAREEFVRAIEEDLHWLGLAWEQPVMRQSARSPAYRAALDRLAARELLYPCFCTRAEIALEIARASEAPHGPDGPLYPGTCRSLNPRERERRMAAGHPYALRFDSVAAARLLPELTFCDKGESGEETRMTRVDPLLFGDAVLARKETPAAYHLAVVVDDAEQNVTLVTRGQDLLPATHFQRILQTLLGLPEPHYAHHHLVTNAVGVKLSKRDGALSLRALRAGGHSAVEVRDLALQSYSQGL
ncbi:MAG TPA: tRNA glutamyl-Q(34) synthetase GluQRS [Rhizomicrobium sp.]|jgi:glutamyl-Q tRNA(Asp) synthetase